MCSSSSSSLCLTIVIALTASRAASLPVIPDSDEEVVVNLSMPALLSTNWTAAEDTFSSQTCVTSSYTPQHCQLAVDAMVGRSTPLEQRSACLWSYVSEEDPLRIPRVIRHVRCSCTNCQMDINSMYGTGCVEQHVTIPLVYCKNASDVRASHQCHMYLQRISVACVCAYKLQVK